MLVVEAGVEAGVEDPALGPLSGRLRRALEPYNTLAASSYARAASSAVP